MQKKYYSGITKYLSVNINKKLKIEVPEGHKQCSPNAIHGCGKVKLVSAFNKKKASKDGYNSICKECDIQKRRKYYLEFRSGEREYTIAKTKRCPSCETTFDNPYEAFSEDTARKDKLAGVCKECTNISRKKREETYRSGKKEHVLVETKRCWSCETTFDNPYEAFSGEPSKKDGLRQTCMKCDVKRVGFRRARTRAKKKGIPFNTTLKLWIDVYRDTCEACETKLKYGKGKFCNNSATMDRIIPSKGYVGGHYTKGGNLQCLCQHCNAMKLNDDSSKVVRGRAKLVLKAHINMANVMEAVEKGKYKPKAMAQGMLF